MRLAAPLLLIALLALPLAAGQSSMPPQPQSVWTVFTTVEAEVHDNFARVKIIEDIGNRGPDPEFPFVVRVPDDAFVTGLVIERDGTVFEAQIKDRAVAREEYEEWKAQGQTGGLVEKARRTNVYSYLINVAEFTSVRATLTYERYLAADRGIYNLSLEAPVSGFGRDLGARFTVTVHDQDGVTALWGESGSRLEAGTLTYDVGPRQGVESPTSFTASYVLDPTADAGTLLTTIVDGKGYFVHRFRAEDDARQLPMDLVLVLDVSGSMAGLKLQQMIDSSKQVIGSLHDEDRLHIVAFSSDARSSWSGLLAMTPENRLKAVREIDALFDAGGTNIESGLRRGFAGLSGVEWAKEEERFPALVILTDGQPTSGITTRPALLQLAKDLNTRDIPVFGIAFGDDADWQLIRSLASDADGAAIRVPPGQGAEVDLRRFMAALTTPVLRDVHIAYSDGVVAYEPGAPVLFAGSELLVVGTYDPARGISGTITGWAPDGERRYSFSGGSDAALSFLPRAVGYHEVRMLQEQEEAEGATASTTQRITKLALDHGFVTDHTSLVLTLPPREMREFTLTMAQDDARGDAMSNASTCNGCATTMSQAQGMPVPAAPPNGGSPLGLRTRDASGMAPEMAYDSSMPGDPTPSFVDDHGSQPSAQVPAPSFVWVLVAVAAIALALRRR